MSPHHLVEGGGGDRNMSPHPLVEGDIIANGTEYNCCFEKTHLQL